MVRIDEMMKPVVFAPTTEALLVCLIEKCWTVKTNGANTLAHISFLQINICNAIRQQEMRNTAELLKLILCNTLQL